MVQVILQWKELATLFSNELSIPGGEQAETRCPFVKAAVGGLPTSWRWTMGLLQSFQAGPL